MSVVIYALSDPETGEIRYVGKTVNRRSRLREHFNSKGETHREHWLRSLKKQGKMAVMEDLEITAEDSWEEAERFWIAYLRFLGCRLTNSDNGGLSKRRVCEESRAKLRSFGVTIREDIFYDSIANDHAARWVFMDLLILADRRGVIDVYNCGAARLEPTEWKQDFPEPSLRSEPVTTARA